MSLPGRLGSVCAGPSPAGCFRVATRIPGVLAPALLAVVWLTGMESTSRARRVDALLNQLGDFVGEALDEALQNRIHLRFPW